MKYILKYIEGGDMLLLIFGNITLAALWKGYHESGSKATAVIWLSDAGCDQALDIRSLGTVTMHESLTFDKTQAKLSC